MMARVLAVPLLAVSVAAVPAVAAASGQGTGTVRVHAENYAGQPIKGLKFCPTRAKANPDGKTKGTLVGKCGVTNSHGIAMLKQVRPGKRWATYYASGDATSSKRVTVKAGATTTSNWKLAE